MLFWLFIRFNRLAYRISGVIGTSGKTYFSAMDVAQFIQIENPYTWAERFASCHCGDVMPAGCYDYPDLIRSEWVIEYESLICVLSCRMSSSLGDNIKIRETKLIAFLKLGCVKPSMVMNKITYLDEISKGPSFLTWMKDRKRDMLNTPTWITQLGIEP